MKNKDCEDLIKADIDKLIQKGWDIVNTDCKRSKCIADNVAKLSKKHNYEVGLAHSMLLQARIHVNNGEYTQAANFAMQGSVICNRLNDIDGKIKADHVMGFMCSRQGNLEAALSYYQNGLKLMKENNKEIDCAFLNNIAVIYYETGKIDEAMTLYLEALEIAEKLGHTIQGLILSNIADAYLLKANTEAALEYNNRAYEILKSDNEKGHYLANCYGIFALIYTQNKQWDRAMDNFMKSLQIYQDIGQKYMEAVQLFEIGKFYLLQDKYQEGIDYLQGTVKIAEETTSEGILEDAYRLLSQSYEKLQQYKEAFEYLTKYNELNEKIKTKELKDRLAQQMTELKVEKAQKDAEIERLKNIELKRQAEEINLKTEILAATFKDIKIIGEIGQKLTATLDFKKVINLIYRNIHKMMDADVFGICLYNEAEGQIDFKMFMEHGKRLPLLKIMIDNEKSLAAKCILQKKEIFLNEASEEGRVFMRNQAGMEIRPKSIIYYPLLLEDKVIGAITVQSLRVNAYTERSIEMLKALASYIAIALYNSQKSEELKEKTHELEILSKTDTLTGLFNRRHIMNRIDEECHRYDRTRREFCVVVLDIDHFKNINDIYGHNCGDYILVHLAKILKSFMRKQDILARWGGEEFLIMLPDTDSQGAVALCERIRQKLDEKRFVYMRKKVKMTATFGVAQYNHDLGIDAVIINADKALYEGKNKGRNCVVAG